MNSILPRVLTTLRSYDESENHIKIECGDDGQINELSMLLLESYDQGYFGFIVIEAV